jgi:hypothetical protein
MDKEELNITESTTDKLYKLPNLIMLATERLDPNRVKLLIDKQLPKCA